MKNKYLMVLILILAFVLSSCNDNEAYRPLFAFNVDNSYIGFNTVEDVETPAEAGKAGYVAIETQKILHNADYLDQFIKESGKSIDTSLRLVYFYSESKIFMVDLFYFKGRYYIFDNSTDKQNTEGFEHLLILEGTTGIPLRNSQVIVLTNDSTLTFDQYMKAMVSSNYEVVMSVHPSRLVMFLDPE